MWWFRALQMPGCSTKIIIITITQINCRKKNEAIRIQTHKWKTSRWGVMTEFSRMGEKQKEMDACIQLMWFVSHSECSALKTDDEYSKRFFMNSPWTMSNVERVRWMTSDSHPTRMNWRWRTANIDADARKLCTSKQFFIFISRFAHFGWIERFSLRVLLHGPLSAQSNLIRCGICKLTRSTISITRKSKERKGKCDSSSTNAVSVPFQIDFCYCDIRGDDRNSIFNTRHRNIFSLLLPVSFHEIFFISIFNNNGASIAL